MGRQYGGIPLASALLFAGIFATLHHVLWLPLAVALMAMILLTETELRLGFDAFEVRKHLGPLTVQTKSWNLADMEGVVLAEYKDATQYVSHSQFNVVQAHSFILTARIGQGHDTEDVEMFEFATKSQGMEVLQALADQNVKTP